MTDYYIIHETPFGTERSLYQKVERRMAENDQELADRCHAIIDEAKKQYLGNFFFTDDDSLHLTAFSACLSYLAVSKNFVSRCISSFSVQILSQQHHHTPHH